MQEKWKREKRLKKSIQKMGKNTKTREKMQKNFKKWAKSLESRRKSFPSAKKLRIGKNHQKVEKIFSICHLCANI